jgi:hypothetical protein
MSRHLLQQIWRLPRLAVKQVVTTLLRGLLLINRPARLARSGFVLPTTALLVLMVLLTATALTYRAFTRSDQAITQREQQTIVNAATPAIDRAKAKIEFIFQEDPRFPSGVPASDRLSDLMANERQESIDNDETSWAGYTQTIPLLNDLDPFTFPGETRLDINDDGELDNAWMFYSDINGDGTVNESEEEGEIVVYSILVDDVGPEDIDPNADAAVALQDPDDQAKANALVTRTGPISTTQATAACGGAIAEGGWQIVQAADRSTLQKNFQINVFVANNNPANRTFEAMEFQQSRIAARSSKWGAWFRYDLEIHPGPNFKWNGAMHTDGNLVLNGGIEPFMVSSHNSCFYTQRASEITLGQFEDNDGEEGLDLSSAQPGAIGDFQGQAIKAKTDGNEYTGGNLTVHVLDTENTQPDRRTFNRNSDSVNEGSSTPADIAMNPLLLFIEDEEAHIDPTTWERDEDGWDNGDFTINRKERIYNERTDKPFVDDFYRADNRWGPKPRYQANNDRLDVTSSLNDTVATGDEIIDRTEATNDLNGFDGFWERQAITTGLRLIVGQRLEIGNANGWGDDPTGGIAPDAGDPLYPHRSMKTALPGNTTVSGGNHQHLHRKSLRDNLSAVQGMVVYHYQGAGMAAADTINGRPGEFPAFCMALTAHPGTMQTIINSRTFEDYPSGALKVDFLHGQGTNGWEFAYQSDFDTETAFETQYNSASGDTPLKKALKNLAYFAGDPRGGAPSFAAVQDEFVHPFPYLAMWGDFSTLRRIIDSGEDYDALSFADKATLHSAACTLSLLTYNLNTVNTEFNAITDPQWLDTVTGSGMAQTLLNLVDEPINGIPLADVEVTAPETWIARSEASGASPEEIELMQTAVDYWQVLRDRTFGFASGAGLEAAPVPAISFGTYAQPTGQFTLENTGTFTYTKYTAGDTYEVGCDPHFFSAKGIATPEEALTLALALCPKKTTVKYPSLYYLFPRAGHDQNSSADATELAALGIADTTQPDTEEYIDATAINPGLITTYEYGGVLENGSAAYQVIGTVPDNLADLAAVPKSATLSDWVLPTGTKDPGVLTDAIVNQSPGSGGQPFAIQLTEGATDSLLQVPFLDKGLYDGREMLNVRVLDIDIEALTTTSPGSGLDFWLSADEDNNAEGVVYAFREDAVREDEIVRPKDASATIDFCITVDKKTGNDTRLFELESDSICFINADSASPQDPPLTNENISLKPVDFVPDPERRAHGFRLRTATGNPADFSGGNPTTGRQVGMTLVSDNSVYIMGNFNPHSSDGSIAGGSLLEEFQQTITDRNFNFNNFYRDRTNTNPLFANVEVDHWRPVEILSDAIAVLSGNFIDGAISDTFTNRTNNLSSYTNQTRPEFNTNKNLNDWVQENPDDPTVSPIWIDRNGTYYYRQGTGTVVPFFVEFNTNNEWLETSQTRNLPDAETTYVNAVFVSGITPKRPNQGYGGLHNFPRFLEDWNNQDLFIQGSFIQLNFSTASTGPYEQEGLEPGSIPVGAELIRYYRPPNRRWGYDVGLLYAPPAPAARRFVSIDSPRSEYYREVPADDPYIVNLRCAKDVDEEAILPQYCPS